MEENQNTQPQSDVSFPTVGEPKKSGGPKMLLVIGILILVGILGFVIYKSASKKSESTMEPTPFDNLTPSQDQTQVAPPAGTPAATSKPVAVDKSKIEIQVQNGTGITGEAAYLQTQLKTVGYTNTKVGNAGEQTSQITTVTFSSTLDASVVADLTQKLNAIYQTVTVKTATTTTFDVVVVTGLRKGVTPKPSATASPTPSSTPSPIP